MTALKPCPNPWCYSHSRDFPLSRIGILETPIIHGRIGFRGHCADCGLLGPVVERRQDAYPAWNTRATDLPTVLAYESGQQSMQAEIERLNKAIKTQAAAVRTLRANEETELNQLREERKKWHGAISTLDSERAANAILTAEIERLREALRPFAKAAMGVETFSPAFPMDGAVMRASVDWYDCSKTGQLARQSVRRRDLEAARQALGGKQ